MPAAFTSQADRQQERRQLFAEQHLVREEKVRTLSN